MSESSANKREAVLRQMVLGFRPLSEQLDTAPLTPGQRVKLNLMVGVAMIARAFYLPLAKLFGWRADIQQGMEEATGIQINIRQNSNTQPIKDASYSDDVAEFEKNGVLGPFEVLSPDEAAALRRRADALHANDFDGRSWPAPKPWK